MALKKTFIANIRGIQGYPGLKGDQGLPGVNAVANDTATAGYINTAGVSETKTAVLARINAATTVKAPGTGGLMFKLAAATQCAVIQVVSDSTGVYAGNWFDNLTAWLVAKYPAYNVHRMEWDPANERFAPRTTIQTGPSGVRYYTLAGSASDRQFKLPNSVETTPTADMVIRAKVNLPTVAPTGTYTIAGKYDSAASARGWWLDLLSTGILSFTWSADNATNLTRVSTAALPGSLNGVNVHIQVSLDVNNGAAGHDVIFRYSTDGTTWILLGSVVTTAGTTALFAANTPLQFNGRTSAASTTQPGAKLYEFKMFTDLACLNSIVEIDLGMWDGAAAAFPAIKGGTVAVTGTAGSITGSPLVVIVNGSAPGQVISYANDATRFPKLTPIKADLAFINFSHNETVVEGFRDAYKVLADAMSAKWPDAGIVAVLQNPRTAPLSQANQDKHTARLGEIAALAYLRGWLVADFYRAILRAAPPISTYVQAADGIHPTAAGYQLEADSIKSLFTIWE